MGCNKSQPVEKPPVVNVEVAKQSNVEDTVVSPTDPKVIGYIENLANFASLEFNTPCIIKNYDKKAVVAITETTIELFVCYNQRIYHGNHDFTKWNDYKYLHTKSNELRNLLVNIIYFDNDFERFNNDKQIERILRIDMNDTRPNFFCNMVLSRDPILDKYDAYCMELMMKKFSSPIQATIVNYVPESIVILNQIVVYENS